jgi:hypothetical protein
MLTIFISYRRADSEAIAYRIYDRLVAKYGKDSLIIDVDNIPLGADFRECLNDYLRQCAVMLAVIGKQWSGIQPRWWLPGHRSRLEDEGDWVRLEIEAALNRKIPLFPILVNQAEMPKVAQLPRSIQPLAYRQGMPIGGPREFEGGVARLVREIDGIFAKPTPEPPSAEVAARTVEAASVVASIAPQDVAVERNTQPTPSPERTPPITRLSVDESGFERGDHEMNSRDRHLFAPGPKRILAIDGAGVRNVISLAFLERIEELLSERNDRPSPLSDYFDFIGGTSVGAFLATLLALGYPTSQIKEFFLIMAPATFKRRLLNLPGLNAKFDPRRWGAEIEAALGDRSLDTPDLKTGLCVVTKRMDLGKSWILTNNPRAPYWAPRDSSSFGNRRYRLADLVRASMAAPGFEPVELPTLSGENRGTFVDGSFGIHGNPSLIMLLTTMWKSYNLCWPAGPENLTITSVGGGSIRPGPMRSRGKAMKQLWYILDSLLSLTGETEDFVVAQMQLLGESATPWVINSEVGSLQDDQPPGGKWFRFLRYDVRLNQRWLRDSLDMDLPSATIAGLQRADDPAMIALLYQIGREAAVRQIKPEHLH